MALRSACSCRTKAATRVAVIVRAAHALSIDSSASRCSRATHRRLGMALGHFERGAKHPVRRGRYPRGHHFTLPLKLSKVAPK